MIENSYIIFIIFLILVNLIFLNNSKSIGKLINIYDLPTEKRKIHKTPIPILGGLIIFMNILFFIIFGFFNHSGYLFEVFISTELKGLIYFLIGISAIFFIGLYDDKYNIRPFVRLILLSILIYSLIKTDNNLLIQSLEFSFTNLTIDFNLGKVLLSYLCIITLLISCNMSDGINLQSSIFYFLNFLVLYFLSPNDFILLILFAILIFSVLNFNGRIFLGDSGSYLLSILLSFYFIKYYNFNIIPKADQIFLFLFFPVLDASRCFYSRLIKGNSIFLPDNNHFHHILLNKIGYKKTVITLSCFYFTPFIGYLFNLSTIYVLTSIIIIYFFFLYKFKS
ncbi:MAG: hypothetical protein CMM99_01665 [Rickettsiales bacterium]|nr:hypothetical protein [Rickettsiales bacterium]